MLYFITVGELHCWVWCGRLEVRASARHHWLKC